LVMVTSSLRPALDELELSDSFDAKLNVPSISTLHSMKLAIKELELFTNSGDLQRTISRLEDSGFGKGDEFERTKRSVGIKKLLTIVEMVRQEPDDLPNRFVSAIMSSVI